MPKTNASAAGGAMPASEPPDITDIQDELCRARNGIQAAFMACTSLSSDVGSPLTTILDDALERIIASEASLEALKIGEKANA